MQIDSPVIIGTMSGTASIALSASFVATASTAISSSRATTSSFATTSSRLEILNPAPLTSSYVPSGSFFIYSPTVSSYVVNTVDGIANNDVAFVTPWNFSLKMNLTEQQFFISVDSTGATRYAWGTKISNYNKVSTSVINASQAATFWSGPVAGTWYTWWSDTTLAMGSHGDTEWGTFRAATGQTPFSLGQYEEYQLTMVLGNAYNNNYFRVVKIK